MDLDLDGTTALVTGASRGIGRAVARCLAEEGCSVAINARDAEGLEKLAGELTAGTAGTVVGCPGDMSGQAEARRVVHAAIDQLGHLDSLVTCAGSVPGGLLTEIRNEEWLEGLELKLLGDVRCCREVLPHMEERGSGSTCWW